MYFSQQLNIFLREKQHISGHPHSRYSSYLNHFLMFLIVGIHNQVKPERDCQSCERQTLSQVPYFLL